MKINYQKMENLIKRQKLPIKIKKKKKPFLYHVFPPPPMFLEFSTDRSSLVGCS